MCFFTIGRFVCGIPSMLHPGNQRQFKNGPLKLLMVYGKTTRSVLPIFLEFLVGDSKKSASIVFLVRDSYTPFIWLCKITDRYPASRPVRIDNKASRVMQNSVRCGCDQNPREVVGYPREKRSHDWSTNVSPLQK